ncbi:MAG TPA: Stp1/IreP family PP2C-type Ser/Thr phosphatase [Actinomycetes bacterium]
MAFRLGASSDVGRMREGNEDSFLASGSLAAVADGMGGHLAGEVASAAATEELRSLQDGEAWRGERSPGDALKSAVMEANRRIREMASGDKSLEGMGTTITALLSDGDVVHLAHVGDSRAYLLRKGELSQLTEDHTLVQELVKQGKLRPEDAKRHPQGSIITRALGVDPEVQVDTATFKIVSGDRLLLCTDGLTGVVDQSTIRNVLLRVRDPQRASEKLVALANEQGGPDNITVVVLDAGGAGADTGVIDPTGDLAADGAVTSGRGIDRGPVPDEVVGREDEVPAGRGRGREVAGRGREARGLRLARRVLGVLVVLVLLSAGILVGRDLVYSRYWVGFDGNQVSIFRGVPGDVAGLHLSSLVERSPVTREKVPPAYVLSLENGVSAGSLTEARRIAACAPVVYQQPDCTIAGPASTTSTPPTTTRPTTTTRKKA